jgi:hypothetical protein
MMASIAYNYQNALPIFFSHTKITKNLNKKENSQSILVVVVK